MDEQGFRVKIPAIRLKRYWNSPVKIVRRNSNESASLSVWILAQEFQMCKVNVLRRVGQAWSKGVNDFVSRWYIVCYIVVVGCSPGPASWRNGDLQHRESFPFLCTHWSQPPLCSHRRTKKEKMRKQRRVGVRGCFVWAKKQFLSIFFTLCFLLLYVLYK